MIKGHLGLKSLEQLVVDTSKATVAHTHHMIPGPYRLQDLADQCAQFGRHLRTQAGSHAQGSQCLRGIPVEASRMAKDQISGLERPR